MKKCKIFLAIIIIYFFSVQMVQAFEMDDIMKSQEDSVGVTNFVQESSKYTTDVFEDIDLNEILTSAITGKVDNKKLLKSVWKIFGNELQSAITVLGSIIIIIIINSILNCITEGLQNKSVSKIAYYVQYILIVTIVLTNFSSVIASIKESINNMTDFTNMLIPIMMTLIVTTGSVTTAAAIQPILIFMISLIGNFINNIAIPIILVSTALGIISKISNKVQIDRLAKRLKSTTIWIIGIILTLFVTLVSVDGTLSSSVDAVTSKTAKAAVSNLIPVVGKILGDAVDSVIGCSSILKNAVGILGVIIIIAISITPIIKLLILMGIYYIGAAICEPIADEKVVKLLDQMGDTFKILLAFMCSMSVMIIIGTTLVLKISNNVNFGDVL
ncbi:MAG: stage III sporulation protein AE [Clostridia bacterium]|nr:stage III sporulation protein AE [Clostridia bacterium]